VAVIAVAVWEEGFVTARGNPKNIRGLEEFSRKDVAIVNRETGPGSRDLLDSRLQIAIRRRHLELPRIQNLLDTLSRPTFRRKLEGLDG
jgi:molybdate-binding protein